MRAVVQVTSECSLACDGKTLWSIGRGMCVLLGIAKNDTQSVADKMIDKLLKLRIFPDENGKLNLSALQTGAEIAVISNFTLYADASRSRRPDFAGAMPFSDASVLYESFLASIRHQSEAWTEEGQTAPRIYGGVFGGDMQVSIVNDGPLTVILDSDTF